MSAKYINRNIYRSDKFLDSSDINYSLPSKLDINLLNEEIEKPRLYLILGEPGMGKSMLINELAKSSNTNVQTGIFYPEKVVSGIAFFDALDEIPSFFDRKKTINDIVEWLQSDGNHKRFFLTCRTAFIAGEIENELESTKSNISFDIDFGHIPPFSPNQVYEFLKANLIDKGLSQTIYNRYFQNEYVMWGVRGTNSDILTTPRYLKYLCILINDGIISADNLPARYKLFELMVDHKLKTDTEKETTQEWKSMKSMVKTLQAKLALIMKINNTSTINEQSLADFFDRVRSNYAVTFAEQKTLKYFRERSLLKPNSADGSTEFDNKEMFDFLVAWELERLGRADQTLNELAFFPGHGIINENWLEPISFLAEKYPEIGLNFMDRLLTYDRTDDISKAVNRVLVHLDFSKINTNNLNTPEKGLFSKLFHYFSQTSHNHYPPENFFLVMARCFTEKDKSVLFSGFEFSNTDARQKKLWMTLKILNEALKQNVKMDYSDFWKVSNSMWDDTRLNENIFDLLLNFAFHQTREHVIREINLVIKHSKTCFVKNRYYLLEKRLELSIKLNQSTEEIINCYSEALAFPLVKDNNSVSSLKNRAYSMMMNALQENTKGKLYNDFLARLVEDNVFLANHLNECVENHFGDYGIFPLKDYTDTQLIRQLIINIFNLNNASHYKLPGLLNSLIEWLINQNLDFGVELVERINLNNNLFEAYHYLILQLSGSTFKENQITQISNILGWDNSHGWNFLRQTHNNPQNRSLLEQLFPDEIAQIQKANEQNAVITKQLQVEQTQKKEQRLNIFLNNFQNSIQNYNTNREDPVNWNQAIAGLIVDSYNFINQCGGIIETEQLETVKMCLADFLNRIANGLNPNYEILKYTLFVAQYIGMNMTEHRSTVLWYLPFISNKDYSDVSELITNLNFTELEISSLYIDYNTNEHPHFSTAYFVDMFIDFVKDHPHDSVVPLLEKILIGEYQPSKAYNYLKALHLIDHINKPSLEKYKKIVEFITHFIDYELVIANKLCLVSPDKINQTLSQYKDYALVRNYIDQQRVIVFKENEQYVKEIINGIFSIPTPPAIGDRGPYEQETKFLWLKNVTDGVYLSSFIDLLRKSIPFLFPGKSKDEQAWGQNTLIEVAMEYFSNQAKQRNRDALTAVEKLYSELAEDGNKAFKIYYDRIVRSFAELTLDYNFNLSINQYNELQDKQYLSIRTTADLYDLIKKILEVDIRKYIESEGAYHYLNELNDNSNSADENKNVRLEELMQRTLANQFELSLARRGIKIEHTKVTREPQLLNNRRIDFEIIYGLAGPVLVEFKMAYNPDIKITNQSGAKRNNAEVYANETMRKYMEGYRASHGLLVIFDQGTPKNGNRHLDGKKVEQLQDIYSKEFPSNGMMTVEVLYFDCNASVRSPK